MIEQLILKGLNHKITHKKKKLPTPNHPDLPPLFFTYASIGMKNSGKSYAVVSLISLYEKYGVTNGQGEPMQIRTIWASPTANMATNTVIKTLKSLHDDDIHENVTEELLKEIFEEMARQIEELTGVEPGYYNSMLANVFEAGQSIGAHQDNERIFVRENKTIGKVATISQGASATITISNKKGKNVDEVTTGDGDLYIMPGQMFQVENKHAVGGIDGRRISLTFRHIPKNRLPAPGETVKTDTGDSITIETTGEGITPQSAVAKGLDMISKEDAASIAEDSGQGLNEDDYTDDSATESDEIINNCGRVI